MLIVCVVQITLGSHISLSVMQRPMAIILDRMLLQTSLVQWLEVISTTAMFQLLMIQPVLHMVVIVLSLVYNVQWSVVFQVLVILNNDIISITQQELWLIYAVNTNIIYFYVFVYINTHIIIKCINFRVSTLLSD